MQLIEKLKKIKIGRKKRKKPNIYALFQFTAFVALIFALIGMVIIGYMVFLENVGTGKHISFTKEKLMEGLGSVLQFTSSSKLVFPASLLIYSSFGLFISSWYIGSRIFYCKNRTLFDSLFLVFMMIPVLANLFALIAQFVEKEFFIAEAKIDKDKIVEEQTKLIKLEISKEKKKINDKKLKLEQLNLKKENQKINLKSTKENSKKIDNKNKAKIKVSKKVVKSKKKK